LQRERFVQFLQQRKKPQEEIERSLESVSALETFLSESLVPMDEAGANQIQGYLDENIRTGKNTLEGIVALARYYYCIGRTDAYIYFTSLVGGLGVYENIVKRLEKLLEKAEWPPREPEKSKKEKDPRKALDEIWNSLTIPPLGSSPEKFPPVTAALVNPLEKVLEPEVLRNGLAGNNHGIPKEAFDGEKKALQEAGNLDAYLKDLHARKVEELQRFCAEGQVWFEQKITPAVVEFVKQNQEILSGVRENNKVYMTKIPYDAEKFLVETDPDLRRYYACHCPLAREAILHNSPTISPEWCYCSAGFEKYPLEVLFDRQLEVEVLESVLKGDPRCRFAITIPVELLP